MNTSSEESLISVQNGSQRASTPDLVRLDTENLGEIIVGGIFVLSFYLSMNRMIGMVRF